MVHDRDLSLTPAACQIGTLHQQVPVAERVCLLALPPIERKGAMPGDSKECILSQPPGLLL